MVNGQPEPNVKVYVYEPGTTNEIPIYEDEGVTPITQPILTDSQGRYAFFVDVDAYPEIRLYLEKDGVDFSEANEDLDGVPVPGSGAGGSGATQLNDLFDVTITSPANNELLAYDAGSGKWINQTPSEAGILAADGSVPLAGDLDMNGYSIDNLLSVNSRTFFLSQYPSLQAAIDAAEAAGGGQVICDAAPDGSSILELTSLVKLKSHITVIAPEKGSFVIKMADGANLKTMFSCGFQEDAEWIILKNLVLDANTANQTDGQNRFFQATIGDDTHCVKHLYFIGCEFRNQGSHKAGAYEAFYFPRIGQMDDIHFEDCYFHDIADRCIYAVNTGAQLLRGNWCIRNCRFKNVNTNKNVGETNNIGSGTRLVLVEGNEFDTVYDAIDMYGDPIIVRNNTFHSGEEDNITLKNGSEEYPLTGIVIGNKVTGGYSGINIAQPTKWLVIANNIIRKVGGCGVQLVNGISGLKGALIIGNIISDCGQSAASCTDGIRSTAVSDVTLNGIYIADNIIFDDQDPPTQRYGVCADGDGHYVNCWLGTNIIFGNSNAPFSLPSDFGHKDLGSDPYAARAYLSTDQTIATDTNTLVALDAESYDLQDNFDTSTHKYVVPYDGLYHISAVVWFEGASDQTTVEAKIYVNGNLKSYANNRQSGTGWLTAAIDDYLYLNQGNEITLYAKHTEGADLTIRSGAEFTHLTVKRER